MQCFMLFVCYEEEFERSECAILPRKNPLQEYDNAKFRQRFRLSKFAIVKLLDDIHHVGKYHKAVVLQVQNPFCE